MSRIFRFTGLESALTEPLRIVAAELGLSIDENGTEEDLLEVIVSRQEEGLQVTYQDGRAGISYHKRSEFFRGLGLLAEAVKEGREVDRKEAPSFAYLTYMQDNSRNAVSNVESLQKLIRQLALMGYTSLMLYTEDTYEIEGYPYFGYQRGRFSKDELKQLVSYGELFGIELVPCIQTLAHLNAIFQWEVFGGLRDTGDILLCGNEKTYELIEAMIKTCSEAFASRRINIGMDEAEMLGMGRYLKMNGFTEPAVIMNKHLQRVLAICKKYGFQAMMWSDMFFKMLPNNSEYYSMDAEITEQIKDKIPKDVKLVYWDYYTRDKKVYDNMILRHKMLSDRIAFAGGAWKWQGFAPLLHHSLMVSELALSSCKEHGVTDVIVTGWGDNGAETSNFVVGPVLQLYAEACYSNDTSKESLSRRLYTCTHMVYEDYMELDQVNLTPDNPSPGLISAAPPKYLLYQDALQGLYDKHVDERTYPEHYRNCHKSLSEIAGRNKEYSYIFDTLAKLSHVLELKCDLGIRLKAAYDRKDKEELKRIAEEECPEIIRRIESFHEAFRKQWFMENKPFGFDVQDIRIGALKERINAVTIRIREYLSGKVDRVEELEQERLLQDFRKNPAGHPTFPLWYNEWRRFVTASVL